MERKRTCSQAGYCLQRAGGTRDDRRCRPRCCQQHGTSREWRRSGCSSSRIHHDHRAGTYPPPRQAVLALEAWAPPPSLLAAPSSASRSDSHGPFLSCGHWQDPSVAAFVICMGAVPALWVALVCVALLCTLLPMARRTRPPMRALMHHSPALAATLQRSSASLVQIRATSSPSLRAAKGRKRRRRGRKPTQSHQAAATSVSADPHTYVPPSIPPLQRAVGHRTLRSNGAQSKAETRSIRDPLVTASTDRVGL